FDLWLAAGVFFLYAPVEGMISLWATSSLKDLSEEEPAGKLLTGFWVGFLASRLLVGLIEHSGLFGDRWAGWFIVVPLILAGALLGNISGAARRGSAMAGFVLVGVFLGPVLPTLLAVVFKSLVARDAGYLGLAYGGLFAAGVLGSMVFRPM